MCGSAAGPVHPPARLCERQVKKKGKKAIKKESQKKKEERERSPGRGRPQIPRTHVGTDSDSIAPSPQHTVTDSVTCPGHISPPPFSTPCQFFISISLFLGTIFLVPSSFYRNTPVFSEKVCVVTCCFRSSVFILSVLRTPGKKKKNQTRRSKKRGKPKGGYLHLGVLRRTPRFLVFSLVFFLCPPYPCSTVALCFQQL
jgi:hypothetical protein